MIFEDLCTKAKATGNLAQDAWFAALAIESGCEWITTDWYYARFPWAYVAKSALDFRAERTNNGTHISPLQCVSLQPAKSWVEIGVTQMPHSKVASLSGTYEPSSSPLPGTSFLCNFNRLDPVCDLIRAPLRAR
jgi:hypothetical protein